jgi:pimeloyl-ACP methyl ester carboxylesterase
MEFIKEQKLNDLTVVGESIGAVLAMTLAAEEPGRIGQVFALNPYDYGRKFGGGIRQSENGWIISLYSVFRSSTPVPKFVLKKVIQGGFAEAGHLDAPFLDELHRVGQMKGHRKAEYRVFKNGKSWNASVALYRHIAQPVVLIYGKEDWSTAADRVRTADALATTTVFELTDASHFICLERPGAVVKIILEKGNPDSCRPGSNQ